MNFVSFLHIVDSLSEAGIPIVLDGVVRSTHESFGDEGPLLLLLVAENEEDPLLLDGPLGSLDFWIKVVEPTLSARFPAAPVEILLQVAPHHTVFVTILLVHVFENLLIFDRSPVANRIRRRFFQMVHGRVTLARN